MISATLAAVHTADWHRPEGSASPDIRRREIPAAVADTPASPRASARMNNISAWMVRCRSPSCLVFNCISVFFGGHSVYLAVILYCPSSNSDREMQHNQPLSKDLPRRLGAWTVLRPAGWCATRTCVATRGCSLPRPVLSLSISSCRGGPKRRPDCCLPSTAGL